MSIPLQVSVPDAHRAFVGYSDALSKAQQILRRLGETDQLLSDKDLGEAVGTLHRSGMRLVETILAPGHHSARLQHALTNADSLLFVADQITDLRRKEAQSIFDRRQLKDGLRTLSEQTCAKANAILEVVHAVLEALEADLVPTQRKNMKSSTILFFASNPRNTDRIRLDTEARDIEEKIRASHERDALHFKSKWAVRTDDLLQALNEERPVVVHFSGHGAGVSGVVLESPTGDVQLVSAQALKRLFAALKDNIRLVVLNACYSSEQAVAIAEVIDCVVGMTDAVKDDAAVRFSVAFYRALGFGRSVHNAFEQASAAIAMDGFDVSVPKLHTRPGVNPDEVFVLAGNSNPQ